MKLSEFLRLHDGGEACISISYNETSILKPTIQYCEEEDQEEFMESDVYQKISDYTVKRFCVIGGGEYPLELCIQVEPCIEVDFAELCIELEGIE